MSTPTGGEAGNGGMAAELAFGYGARPVAPSPSTVRLTPTKGWPKPVRKSVPFSGLLLFTFVLLLAPQNIFPALGPLMLAKLSVALAVAGYLVNRTMTGRRLTVMTPTVRWALILAGIGILSIPAGFWPGGSVNVFVDYFGKSIVIFLLIANVVDTEARFRILVGSMTACGAITAAYAVANYVGGRFDATGQRVAGYESPLAINPNDLALTLNTILALALGLRPVLRRRWKRMLLSGAMAMMLAGIVVTFSRSGFVTLGVIGAMWAARALQERGGRAVPSIALVALALMVAVPAGYSDRLSTILDTEADPTGSADERWQTMMIAAGYIMERPILGVGLGDSMHVTVARGGLSREAHNAYLKIGAELGVGGLVVYVLFIASALAAARAVRRFFGRRHAGWELGRLAGGVELALVGFAVGALFSPVPYHFYLYYPAGLAVAIFAIGARVPARPSRSARN